MRASGPPWTLAGSPTSRSTTASSTSSRTASKSPTDSLTCHGSRPNLDRVPFPYLPVFNLFFKVRRLPRHRVQLHGYQLRKGSDPLQLRGHPFHFGIAGEPGVVGGDEGRLHPLPVRGLGLPHPPGSLPRPCRGRLVHRPAGVLISSKTPSTYPRNCVTKIYDSHLSLCADVQTAERKLLKLVRKIMINRLIFF